MRGLCIGCLLLIIIAIAIFSSVVVNNNGSSDDGAQIENDSNATRQEKAALNKAKTYSDTMHMSKQGIYEQLTSSYGEKFNLCVITIKFFSVTRSKLFVYTLLRHMHRIGICFCFI